MFKPNSGGDTSTSNSGQKKGLHPPTVPQPSGPRFFISKLGTAKYDETGRVYFEINSDKHASKPSLPI